MSSKNISIIIQVILYLWAVFMTLWLTVVGISSSNHLVTVGFFIIAVIVAYPLYRGAQYFWKRAEKAG